MGVASLIAAVALVVGTAVVPARASDWPVFGHDPARSGVDAGDRALSATMVGKLRERWQTTLDDVADSTPIFLSHVGVKGRSRAMLFQTAKNGTTYGIDARSGRIDWRFATHGPKITTSTPAADPSGRWIYAGGVDGFIHKLDAATGIELRARSDGLRFHEALAPALAGASSSKRRMIVASSARSCASRSRSGGRTLPPSQPLAAIAAFTVCGCPARRAKAR